MSQTVYISIGNSDDKLTQNEWAHFVEDVRQALRNFALAQHGEWFSATDSPWQNAVWCAEVRDVMIADLRNRLAATAKAYRQDSIAWAVADVDLVAAAS
ncbi:hypothetical protein [Micromonospora tulbaghiae]|uniref:hypothetical protein n=1 Tax=Micromonospora tulbaghiae TaxID=479978 RepID=UPI0033F66CCF